MTIRYSKRMVRQVVVKLNINKCKIAFYANAKVGRREPSAMSSAVGLYGLGEKK